MNGAVCVDEDIRDTASSTHKKRAGMVRCKKSKTVECTNIKKPNTMVSDASNESVNSNDA